MGYGMWGWGPGWGLLVGLTHLLFWALVIAAVVTVARSRRGERWAAWAGRDRSQAILRERYARGEIDQKDFEERMQYLASGAGRGDQAR